MKISTIKVPAGTLHLSEVISTLPKDCLFNKGVVGCGGTTIALTDDCPTVVCVPFVSLIENKIAQSVEKRNLYPYEIFGVYDKVSDSQLSHYLMTAEVPKIMVTYDSLHKVLKNSWVVGTDYNLLVDEYHCLFREFPYRRPACMNVMNHYREFKSFTFMTATPIEPEFIFEELRHIQICNAVWEEAFDVRIVAKRCKSPVAKVVINHINNIIINNDTDNHYFFVNSVRFIKQVVKHCKLDKSNCRIICAEKNAERMPFSIQKPYDPAKKINFITKSAFEGTDFYDEVGRTYIVSDGTNAHTLVDIATQFLQIAGRIRDSKYKAVMQHLYSTTRYSENLEYEDFKALMDEELEDERAYVHEVKQMKLVKHRLDAAKGRKLLYHIVDEADGVISEDTKTLLIDLYNYRIMHRDYVSQVSLQEAYRQNNILNAKWVHTSVQVPALPIIETNFKLNVQELEELSKGFEGCEAPEYLAYLTAASRDCDFLEMAITKLGFERIRTLNYHTTTVQRELVKASPRESLMSDHKRVQQLLLLDPAFQPGKMPTVDLVKATLNGCYSELGIKMNAVSNQIEDYFVVRDSRKAIDGKKQRAYTILAKKPL